MKRFRVRIVSTVLVFAMVMALLPAGMSRSSVYAEEGEAEGFENEDSVDSQTPQKLEDELKKIESDALESGRITVTGGRVRGVLDSYGELAAIESAFGNDTAETYSVETGDTAELGSMGNPFLVLEIVPYQEFAEFGYLIDGCEPVDMDLVSDADFTTLAKLGIFKVEPSKTTAYFFEGEPGYDKYDKYLRDNAGGANYYQDISRVTEGTDKVHGYFEKVPGNGHYEINIVEGNALIPVTPQDSEDENPNNANGTVTEEPLESEENKGEQTEETEEEQTEETEEEQTEETEEEQTEETEEEQTEETEEEQTEETEEEQTEETEEEQTEETEEEQTEETEEDQAEVIEEEQTESLDDISLSEKLSEKEGRFILLINGEDSGSDSNTDDNNNGDTGDNNDGNNGDNNDGNTGDNNGDTGDNTGNIGDNYNDNTGDNNDSNTGDNNGDTDNNNGGNTDDNNTGTDNQDDDDSGDGSEERNSSTENSRVEEPLPYTAPNMGEPDTILLDEVMPIANGTNGSSLTITYVSNGTGDWEWHSLTKKDAEDLEDNGTVFCDLTDETNESIVDNAILEFNKVIEAGGGEVFAIRGVTDGVQQYDYVYTGYIKVASHHIYENSDLFLKKSLGKDGTTEDNTAEKYSVVVKTITSEDLKKDEDNNWINRANLIYLSTRKSYSSNRDLPEINLFKIWQNCGWPKKEDYKPEGSGGLNDYRKSYYDRNNAMLDWDTVRALYDKVTAENDYAGLIIDNEICDVTTKIYDQSDDNKRVKKGFNITVHDWNMEEFGTYEISEGSNNNLYKLAVMLLAMDSSLFKKLYLESINDNEFGIIGDNGDISSWQKVDAATYWSVESFLLMNPNVSADDYKEWFSSNKEDYWWQNYHSVVNPTSDKFKYYANDHVFIWQDADSIVRGYSDNFEMVSSEGVEEYKETFSDFAEYLKETDAGTDPTPTPAKAVGYILDDMIKGSEESQASEPPEPTEPIRILELEPYVEVKYDSDGNGSPVWLMRTDSYALMLLPFYDGEVDLDQANHQTITEFNGKFEDLVSGYDLIYLGGNFQTFVGDSDSYGIIKRRQEDLKDFLAAGRLIIAESCYSDDGNGDNDDDDDNGSNGDSRDNGDDDNSEGNEESGDNEENVAASKIWRAVTECAGSNRGNLFGIDKVYEASKVVLQIPKIPDLNNVKVVLSEGSESLMRGQDGKVSVSFQFTVSDYKEGAVDEEGTNYGYRIYVDRDGDLKFEAPDTSNVPEDSDVPEGTYALEVSENPEDTDDYEGYSELIASGDVDSDDTITINLDSSVKDPLLLDRAGRLHWKIEVYDKDNESIRNVETGFTPVINSSGGLEEIRVLQITDNDTDTGILVDALGSLEGLDAVEKKSDTSNNYTIVNKYTISPEVMSLEEYKAIFDGAEFGYSGSTGSETYPSGLENLKKDLLSDYDIIIVDLNETNGPKLYGNGAADDEGDESAAYEKATYRSAAQFLQYWADLGRSIIYLNGLTPGADNAIRQSSTNVLDSSKVRQLNEGLAYPLEVDLSGGVLEVAGTNAQASLSLDELNEMTVWYCLSGEDHAWNDAMNSYYIYSNKNVFYSGIQYSTSTNNNTDDELKLFINMVVAAYNASDDGLSIEITDNFDVVPGMYNTYEIKGIMRNYDPDDGDGYSSDGDGDTEGDEADGAAIQAEDDEEYSDDAEGSDDYLYKPGSIVDVDTEYNIIFSLTGTPWLVAPKSGDGRLRCRILYYDEGGGDEDDGRWVSVKEDTSGFEVCYENGTKIWPEEGSDSESEESTDYFEPDMSQTYILKYPKEYIDSYGSRSARTKIIFEIEDVMRGYKEVFTVVNMSEMPLFPLD